MVGAILVVEDEPLILLDVETALQEAGFEVVAAKDASEAIAAFDAEPEKFKGLVTDIRLGAGQSGWDVAKHLRQANSFFLPQIITALSTLLNAQPTAESEASN